MNSPMRKSASEPSEAELAKGFFLDFQVNGCQIQREASVSSVRLRNPVDVYGMIVGGIITLIVGSVPTAMVIVHMASRFREKFSVAELVASILILGCVLFFVFMMTCVISESLYHDEKPLAADTTVPLLTWNHDTHLLEIPRQNWSIPQSSMVRWVLLEGSIVVQEGCGSVPCRELSLLTREESGAYAHRPLGFFRTGDALTMIRWLAAETQVPMVRLQRH
ncbi:MAG: hypothetical protein ACRC8S_02490 [Fimbriiglobus sp.]